MKPAPAGNLVAQGNSVGDHLLKWFADQGIPMLEIKLRLGGLEYFHFTSYFNLADGRAVASFGSALDRKTAALKCVGEAIERQEMVRFFLSQKERFPKAFRNSNGWAVHSSLAVAKERAHAEALERHLLMLSFFTYGWDGFNLVQTIQADRMSLRLHTSRFTAERKIAGIVAAQSPEYPGVSFGYTVGAIEAVGESAFWQSAIFEAADKFLVLDKKEPGATDESSWLRKGTDQFLEQPFSAETMSAVCRPVTEVDPGQISIEHIDISLRDGLDFPLHAAFAHGGNLIPLFCKSELGEEGQAYLSPILERNGIRDIPERHPIL